MKLKWYLQTWFIGLCFALWFLYGVPLIFGIVLLLLQKRALKKTALASQNLQTELETKLNSVSEEKQTLQKQVDTLNKQFETIGASEYFTVKNKIAELNNEHATAVAEFNAETQRNNKIISQLREEIVSLTSQNEKLSKQINTQLNKLSKCKELYRSVEYALDNFFVSDVAYSNCKLSMTESELLDEYSPSVILKLHALDIKNLRKAYRDNEKQINTLLNQYSVRYTTKANKSIYNLMVIALRAEIQNILYNLKYEKLDDAIEQVKNVSAKYLAIAGEGNQSIAGTLTKFIGEIEYLFINAVKIEYNYYVKKEQSKQEQAVLREQMRQEAEERKALEIERKKIEKEETKYSAEIEKVNNLLSQSQDSAEIEALNKRILELQSMLSDVVVKKEEITNLQNGKAGNVYIISNLGSFGENMFKVGMTRRLNPQDRVNELGDASVPFKFDVHSFIFSEDAVSLEKQLHDILNEKRVNKVNLRKEFFYTSVDELEKLVNDIDPTAEFNRTMAAEEYRQSLSTDEIYTSDAQIEDFDE